MKRSAWIRLLALVLVCCIVAAPTASAAPYVRAAAVNAGAVVSADASANTSEGASASAGTAATGSFWSGLTGWFRSLFGGSDTLAADEGVNAAADTTTTLKYFPVTLYNYDKTTINNATHQVEVNNGLGNTWNGIYFNDGNPSAESFTYTTSAGAHSDLTWAQVQSGTYYSDEACTKKVNVTPKTSEKTTEEYKQTTVKCGTLLGKDSSEWVACDGYYYTPDNGANYYLVYAKRSSQEKSGLFGSTYNQYTYKWGFTTTDNAGDVQQIGNDQVFTDHWYSGDGTPDQVNASITVYTKSTTTTTEITGYTLTVDGDELAKLDGIDTNQQVGVTLYTPEKTETTGSLAYAAWNFWNKGATGNNKNNYGQYTYSGLVESRLDANKNIIFTRPDGGIFNSDATVKDIYTNVEVPFVLDAYGFYTFDASQFGAYFNEGETPTGVEGGKTSTAAQSNGVLYYDPNAQTWSGMDYGDGSKTLWAPFNKNDLTSSDDVDYHFGMRATVPFTMTTNGRLNANDNESQAITFSFSGDDDVWIFIDGQLVIDLGGIHNRLDATINFAENTWSISESNTSTVAVADYNGAAISGTLFNDGDTTGILNTTRETFAATNNHELTIFYLERGAGSSNAQIKFNLPVKDSLSVTKQVSTVDSANQPLDSATLEQINNRDFSFTLYKRDNNVENPSFTSVKNTNYYVLNENGQYLETRSTDANGNFTLKNGQTAKFEGVIDNNSYYVVENKDDGAEEFWMVPTWTYTASVANGVTSTDSTTDGQSMTLTAVGGDEAEDTIAFTCTNVWVHQNNTSISAVDDKIVIDFGLPVVIDVLSNDTVSNGVKSLEKVEGAQYGTAKIEDGKITYQLTKQLTGVEVLTYTVKATASNGLESDNKTASAKIYIIPATSMYYEEDFTGLVTFNDGSSSGWQIAGTAQTDPQEPGVVGTVGDSPYGSDAAYLNDSGDSNGTSKYVNTTSGPASFSYTFTGTGTSFFARTNNNSGYMRIVIKNTTSNEVVFTAFRDTSYKDEEGHIGGEINVKGGILYNIPVFTYEAENYGTYTVTVTIAGGAGIVGKFGTEFWLDGIRVMNPLDSTDANANVAQSAYATDGEANMTVVTLREKLLADTVTDDNGNLVWSGGGFVIFTDTDGEIKTAAEYASNGPKEEVYLNNGQSVTFSLADWDVNNNKIYLGIKAPTGSGTVSINGNTLEIKNATDCFYEISSYAAITNEEDGTKTVTFKIEATSGLISVTNIKVTGSASFVIVPGDDINGDPVED